MNADRFRTSHHCNGLVLMDKLYFTKDGECMINRMVVFYGKASELVQQCRENKKKLSKKENDHLAAATAKRSCFVEIY